MSESAFQIREEYLDHLPARHGETGADYYERLTAVQMTGTWLRKAAEVGRPKHEIDAIIQTFEALTAP